MTNNTTDNRHNRIKVCLQVVGYIVTGNRPRYIVPMEAGQQPHSMRDRYQLALNQGTIGRN